MRQLAGVAHRVGQAGVGVATDEGVRRHARQFLDIGPHPAPQFRPMASAYPANEPGCGGDASRPVPRRVAGSTVRNAVRKEIVAAGSGETGPVWAERLVGCALVALRPQQSFARNHLQDPTIFARTSQTFRQFRLAPLLR